MADHWFFKYLVAEKWSYIQAILASVFINIFSIVTGLYIMVVYNRILPNASFGPSAYYTLTAIVIGVGSIIVVDYIFKVLRAYFLDKSGAIMEKKSSNDVFDKIVDYDIEKAPKTSGAIVSIVREFETFREFFNSASLLAFADLPFTFLFIFVIYLVGGPLAYVPMIVVPTVILFSIILQPFMKRLSEQSLENAISKNSVLTEMAVGLETVKTISGGDVLRERWMNSVVHQSDTNVVSRLLSQLASNFSSMAVLGSQLAVVAYGVVLVADATLSMGALIATMILSGRTLQPLGQLSGLLSKLNSAMSAYRVVSQFMNESSQDEKTNYSFARTDIVGDVEFKEVEFSYPESEQKVLNNISLKFKAGEKVAILGKVGCGKTTILKLILGLHHCSSGSVMIDGANVQQLRADDKRKNIGVVLQNPYLFSGSIRDNIAFGLDVVSEEEILEAAKISCCLDFINKLQNGFDYYLSENGRELSGGQRQSITLARAIVRKPKILLLDEPTSSMDQSTEKLVIENLNNYFGNQTLILVTHRMSLLKMVDRVIAVDEGKVTVDGKKDEILKRLQGFS